MTAHLQKRFPPVLGYCALVLLFALSVFLGLLLGDVQMEVGELLDVLFAGPFKTVDEAFNQSVVWRIRLPRVFATALSGAVLAAAGVAFQAVLRNPLAEPYTLGVASGAAFGAACAILTSMPWVTAASFAGGVGTLFIVWILSERGNEPDVSRVILAGVIVGSVLGAGLTLMKALAGDQVSAIIVWLLGSFSAASWSDAMPLSLAFCIILLVCVSNYKEMDIMASGANASALGLDIVRRRLFILAGASLAVSFVVSRFGIIGFVGLVVPHLLRILFGPSHRTLIPLSLLGGAALLSVADTMAKMWNELPAGVLTVLIGGPVFCVILWNRR
ncbi:MAG: iron ABC transporter permease [Synergistaceae bacterium]|jgi:iron complex transport system permease protein|nr:iron ABC transporter permease [Synergistaceae bacterium]